MYDLMPFWCCFQNILIQRSSRVVIETDQTCFRKVQIFPLNLTNCFSLTNCEAPEQRELWRSGNESKTNAKLRHHNGMFCPETTLIKMFGVKPTLQDQIKSHCVIWITPCGMRELTGCCCLLMPSSTLADCTMMRGKLCCRRRIHQMFS